MLWFIGSQQKLGLSGLYSQKRWLKSSPVSKVWQIFGTFRYFFRGGCSRNRCAIVIDSFELVLVYVFAHARRVCFKFLCRRNFFLPRKCFFFVIILNQFKKRTDGNQLTLSRAAWRSFSASGKGFSKTSVDRILISSAGRSVFLSVLDSSIVRSASPPPTSRPNTVC